MVAFIHYGDDTCGDGDLTERRHHYEAIRHSNRFLLLYVSLHVVCIPMRMSLVSRYFIITYTVFQCDFDGRLGRTISRFIG